MSVWFITGASRGFGRELTEAALAAGDRVVATARDVASLRGVGGPGEQLMPVVLDVTDPGSVSAAVAETLERVGEIDVLVNNAGYGLFGAVEEVSDDEVRGLFDTNVFGLLTVTRALLPALRRQGHGHVVNISSSAGFVSSAGRGLYSASKFAVEAISEALHDELAPLGVRVTVVEPGAFRTDFLSDQSLRTAKARLSDYEGTAGMLVSALSGNDGKQPGDPAKAVAAIREVVASDSPPLRLHLGTDCVALVEGKLARVADELDTWRQLSLSTDVEGG